MNYRRYEYKGINHEGKKCTLFFVSTAALNLLVKFIFLALSFCIVASKATM